MCLYYVEMEGPDESTGLPCILGSIDYMFSGAHIFMYVLVCAECTCVMHTLLTVSSAHITHVQCVHFDVCLCVHTFDGMFSSALITHV
jgi:hypothetical protein